MLEVKNLNVFYGNVQILWDVSLEVGEGEIVALVGANGAGKTTLLNAIWPMPLMSNVTFRADLTGASNAGGGGISTSLKEAGSSRCPSWKTWRWGPISRSRKQKKKGWKVYDHSRV